jgi:hypothetical protein
VRSSFFVSTVWDLTSGTTEPQVALDGPNVLPDTETLGSQGCRDNLDEFEREALGAAKACRVNVRRDPAVYVFTLCERLSEDAR